MDEPERIQILCAFNHSSSLGIYDGWHVCETVEPDGGAEYVRADLYDKVLDLLKRSHGLYCHIGCTHTAGICAEVNELFGKGTDGS